jgi:hypothetical protein
MVRTFFGKDIKNNNLDDFIFERKEYRAKPGNEIGRQLGGQISLRVSSPEVAAKFLKREQDKIGFWQVAVQYKIKFPTDKFARHTTGFSKTRKANETSTNAVRKAIAESAINAVNQQGKQFAYESKAPSYVKKEFSKNFTLIIFVRIQQKESVFGSGKIIPR